MMTDRHAAGNAAFVVPPRGCFPRRRPRVTPGAMQTRALFALAATALLATAGVAQAPGFSESDRRSGAQANPQLTAQFGGAYRGPQADYVRRVGQRIAAQSGLAARASDYTVTLLNSNVNNAFAIPGGYVYVTRNLVALMNSEAELAFVMGHEVGHVAARHAQKRETRSVITGLGAAILGAVTGSSTLGSLAGRGAQLYTLSYSRAQENEADSLGVRYLARAGYDPAAGANILAALEAQSALESRLAGRDAKGASSWLSTHPATAERVARVRREAATLRTPSARALDRDTFLSAIDGMLYDDDPAQGVVQGRSFRHAGLHLAFDAPPGFSLKNGPSSIVGTSPQGGQFQFAGGGIASGDSIGDFAGKAMAAVVGDQARVAAPPRVLTINGIESAVTTARAQGNGGPKDVTVAAYRWGAGQAFAIVAIADAGGDPGFDGLIRSVRRLSPGEAGAQRGRRVAVVAVRPGDTIASLSARMAYGDDRVARFTVLNAIDPARRLVPGDRVKLIVWR